MGIFSDEIWRYVAQYPFSWSRWQKSSSEYYALIKRSYSYPPLEEQKKIEKLFLQLKEAKELAAKYSAQLQEYKNSLIASVVTGQVDIRNIQVEDFDPADLITETDDDPAEDDDQSQEESEVE